MAYNYSPYVQSASVKKKKQQQDKATQIYNNYAKQKYSAGAGGLSSQLKSAQKKKDNLYKNNTLSQQFTYDPQKQQMYDKAYSDIVNRKPFEYDLSDDQLFQQYKDNYQAMGKAAMADTIGEASAMTGGYGNSYATAAGNQTYNNYLQQINNSIGDFYKMALSGYTAETDRLNDVFSAASADRTAAQNEWKGNWDVYGNLYKMYSDDYNNLLSQDTSLYNQRGTNLYNAANLYTNQYNSDSTNAYNIWSTGQNLKAQQAQLEETARHNRETEKAANKTVSASLARASSGGSSKNKTTITPKSTKTTTSIIKSIGSGPSPGIPYIKSVVEKNLNAGKITAGEAAYLYQYYNILA